MDSATSSELAALARAQGFTFEQLEENRAGRLHASQRAALAAKARQGVVLLRVSIVALAVVVLITVADAAIYGGGGGAPEDRPLVFGRFVVRGLLVLPFLVLALVRRARGRRVLRRLAGGRVSICEGPIEVRRWRNGKVRVVDLIVGGGRVRSSEAAAAVVRDGAPYRLYLLEGVDFLGLEPVVNPR